MGWLRRLVEEAVHAALDRVLQRLFARLGNLEVQTRGIEETVNEIAGRLARVERFVDLPEPPSFPREEDSDA